MNVNGAARLSLSPGASASLAAAWLAAFLTVAALAGCERADSPEEATPPAGAVEDAAPGADARMADGQAPAADGDGPAPEGRVPAADRQVEEAVLPLPPEARDASTVLGYDAEGTLVTLRDGDGAFVCLADDPADARFHVACYHRSLEPYMARGRELRAEGLTERESITGRWEEIEAGTLDFPEDPAALFSLHAEGREALAEGGEGSLRRLTVLYVRGATAEETGLPTSPEAGLPWLMMPGQPTAHVMIHD